ncbi:hypothetical protein [Streptomyces sirii]|uniref:hypothetical protein n=1 Tax=Streptomyces sirii TaxID=3127701 RepID=UPI003D369AC2
MPRPTLTDNSFDLSYACDATTTLGRPTEAIDDPQPSPFDVGLEMMLDGAQVLRLGRDLVVNVAQNNHEQGVHWLERHVSAATACTGCGGWRTTTSTRWCSLYAPGCSSPGTTASAT